MRDKDTRKPETIIRELRRQLKQSHAVGLRTHNDYMREQKQRHQAELNLATYAQRFDAVITTLVSATARFDRCAALQIKLENMVLKEHELLKRLDPATREIKPQGVA